MEVRRQLTHIVFGLLVIAFLYLATSADPVNGKAVVELVLLTCLIIGMIVIDLKEKGWNVPVFDELVLLLERPKVRPAHGALWYGLGLLLALSFLNNFNEIAATIMILALGDGLATLVGNEGKIRLPYNNAKTLEGFAAFIIACLPAHLLIGPVFLPLSIFAAFVESANLHLDDNFTVPLACIIFFSLV